ncbi:MAG TPA: TM0106 family RecB-like putative nuclease, partial [Candidatus Nitrosotalea sp.]|nr:TM0106 family RecB-like putative nuclease [Candidatus Nitrosotalea sp.]
MQRLDGRLIFAASDLNNYLECKRLTELETLVALRKLSAPDQDDAQADLLRRKGDEHERSFLERLRSLHPGGIVEFDRAVNSVAGYEEAERDTLAAMRRGVPIIFQATFFDGTFIGRADFLRRIERPSPQLGDYSYEVIDTKLGLRAKPYYLLQLCNYSEHLERLQGVMPQYGHVVFGNGEEQRFRLHDYLAYYRHLKRAFLEFAAAAELASGAEPSEYPFECAHCNLCPWDADCERKRRDDDHLSLVAWMRREQIAKLESAGISRLSTLAASTAEQRPSGMNEETFAKLRRQAKLQVRARESGRPIYELLEHGPPLGFALLPPPAPGDVFFDMEGDPLYEAGRSLEYLFGCWLPDDEPEFRAFWALDREEERRAFEAFVDFVTERRGRYPAMHVYHYAPYEKEALRRLAQQHCTREEEVDDLLRGEVLVDLFAVVRQALAISEERYGLKNVEHFYDLVRETEVKKGDESIVMFERWLHERDNGILADIERYNRDDCRSTNLLRDWLLDRRAEAIETFGRDFPFRADKLPDEPCHTEFTDGCKKCAERRSEERENARRSDLERRLLEEFAAPQNEAEFRAMPAALRVRYLLGNLMAYHRREEKPEWWIFFDRCENVDRLVEFDRDSIGGLWLREEIEPYKAKNSLVYTFEFPEQLYKLGKDDAAANPRTGKGAGTIVGVDADERLLELKTTASQEIAREIRELIPERPLTAKVQRDAVARIGAELLESKLERVHPATYDLLSNRNPRLGSSPQASHPERVILSGVEGRRTRGGLLQPERLSAESISSVVAALDSSYCFIQGPPGSGKSTHGSQVICDLLAAGKRIAVTSTTHKAIHNLLGMVERCMTERGASFRGLYKHSDEHSEYHSPLPHAFIESTKAKEAFYGDDYQLAGGTDWLFAREELDGKFDYLFIDEAGQVSLADALAVSLCAKNVVLLGDPSQLAQVSQGRQPLHAGDSVLEHLLGGDQTVPPHRGIFLDISYRMQPAICDFVSDAMYENRLHAAEETRLHCVTAGGETYAGLYLAGVAHSGNSSSSLEEAHEIVGRIALLLAKGTVTDSRPPDAGRPRRLTERDVIVVTPYNAQLRAILDRLRHAGINVNPETGVRAGTVDKFQGQEAAVVFYSMATSSGEDVPRNVEFLFEPNRFNVAISRARAASVLVCSPRLLDIRCRTPEQMALANLLCSFAERARPLSAPEDA